MTEDLTVNVTRFNTTNSTIATIYSSDDVVYRVSFTSTGVETTCTLYEQELPYVVHVFP